MFTSSENKSFLGILAVICFSFSLSLGGISSDTVGTKYMREINSTWVSNLSARLPGALNDASEHFVTMLNTAFGVEGTTGFSQQSLSDEAFDVRFWYYLFWILTNTYLVQGFLVGIVSEFFSRRQTSIFETQLFKLKLILAYQQTNVPIPLARLPENYRRLFQEMTCPTFGIYATKDIMQAAFLDPAIQTRKQSLHKDTGKTTPGLLQQYQTTRWINAVLLLMTRFFFCAFVAIGKLAMPCTLMSLLCCVCTSDTLYVVYRLSFCVCEVIVVTVARGH